MKFIEITPQQFRDFVLNSELQTYGVSDGVIHKILIKKECVAIRLLLVGSQNCLVREDYLEFCK